MTTPRRVVIIGGGISGLAAARRLRQSSEKDSFPLELKLLEASPRLGGTIQSRSREGFLLESGPDCFISEKPRGVGLCRELGLEDDLIATETDHRRSFIVRRGRFYPVPEGFYLMGPARTRPFLESGLLSWKGKLRAILEPLMPSRPETDESLGSFVRRRFGHEMLDWMAQPLIAGIYGANPDHLSLRATFPQFLEMERLYGSVVFGLQKRQASTQQASGARYSLFVTLRNGMQQLVETLAAKLGAETMETGAPAREIRRREKAWDIVKQNGEVVAADAVLLALPSYASAALLRTVDSEWANELAGIAYASAATINIALRDSQVKRSLDGIGFVVPALEKRLVLGCTLVHQKFAGRVPPGFVLLRAFLGNATGSAEEAFQELKSWLGIEGDPLFMETERYPFALPQYNVGHLQRVVRIEEHAFAHRGLALAGNWAYGVGIPDCIESGERAADALMKKLQAPG